MQPYTKVQTTASIASFDSTSTILDTTSSNKIFKKNRKLDGQLDRLMQFHDTLLYGIFKRFVRSIADQAVTDINSWTEEDFQKTFIVRQDELDQLTDTELKIRNMINEIYGRKSKTKKSLEIVLNALEISFAARKNEMDRFLVECKNLNVEVLFKAIKVPGIEKPDLSSVPEEKRPMKILKWFVKHSEALSKITYLEVPSSHDFLTELPLMVFHFLPGLKEFHCPGHGITILPNLRHYCNELEVLDVSNNFLIGALPSPLLDIQDLRVENQNYPIIWDDDIEEFLHNIACHIPKPDFPSKVSGLVMKQAEVTGEKIRILQRWLLSNKQALACINVLEISEHSLIKAFPIGILQYLTGLMYIECQHGSLESLPDNLMDICKRLKAINVEDNCLDLDEIAPSLASLVKSSGHSQRIPMRYDESANILFNSIPMLGNLSEKPSFDAPSREKTKWLLTNRSILAGEAFDYIEVPEGSLITELPLCVLQYLPNLKTIKCSNGKLHGLPKNLLTVCPRLTKLLVEENFLSDVPESLSHLVDLLSQPQRVHMAYDENAYILFDAIPLEGKPDRNASDEEKTNWLLTNKEALREIFCLKIPPDSLATQLSPCILQYLRNVTTIECFYGQINALPENLLTLCPFLTTLELTGNAIEVVPSTLTTLFDPLKQPQKKPLIYDKNANILFECIPPLENLSEKPPSIASDKEKNLWLHENREILSKISCLEVPENSILTEFSLGILQYLRGLTEIICPHARLTRLPENLLLICPRLTKLNVEKNFIFEIPKSLVEIENLVRQHQFIPMIYDHNVSVLIESIPLVEGLSTKPSPTASDEEKTTWLLDNENILTTIETLGVRHNAKLTDLPICFFQWTPNLKTLDCSNNLLEHLDDKLLVFCSRLSSLNVEYNFLTKVPPSFECLVNLSSQCQRTWLRYDECVNEISFSDIYAMKNLLEQVLTALGLPAFQTNSWKNKYSNDFIKKQIGATFNAIKEDPIFTKFSGKNVLYALLSYQDPFADILQKIREIRSNYLSVVASETIFRAGSSTKKQIDDGGLKLITEVALQIEKFQQKRNIYFKSEDPAQIENIKMLFSCITDVITCEKIPSFESDQKINIAKMMFWLDDHKEELEQLTVLNVSKHNVTENPREFLINYLVNLSEIVCCSKEQADLFPSFNTSIKSVLL